MSFANWKKRSKRFCALMNSFKLHGPQDIQEICQAAYKAGERAGRTQVEALMPNIEQWKRENL